MEERVAIEGDDVRQVVPDVRVFEPPIDSETVLEEATGQGALALKFRLVARIEPVTEKFIKIIEAGTERLVTVIEFVRPSNKRSAGLTAFRAKRADLLESSVNFVEIDLVRAGDWRALLRPHSARKGASLYRATIRLPNEPGVVYLEPIHLRDPLPDLPIPLRQRDANVTLRLGPLLGRIYESGRYARRIDYRKAPEPQLEPADAAWADELLRAAQRR